MSHLQDLPMPVPTSPVPAKAKAPYYCKMSMCVGGILQDAL